MSNNNYTLGCILLELLSITGMTGNIEFSREYERTKKCLKSYLANKCELNEDENTILLLVHSLNVPIKLLARIPVNYIFNIIK